MAFPADCLGTCTPEPPGLPSAMKQPPPQTHTAWTPHSVDEVHPTRQFTSVEASRMPALLSASFKPTQSVSVRFTTASCCIGRELSPALRENLKITQHRTIGPGALTSVL